MPTETAPETETPQAQESIFQGAETRFEDALNAAQAAKDAAAAPESKPKVDAPAKVEAKKAESPDIPEALLGGEKPAEKTPEPSEIDKVLAQDEPSRGKGQWKLVKEHAAKLSAELAQRTKELEEARASTPKADRAEIDEELKTHRAQVEQLQVALEKAAFERSPRYQAFIEREKGNIESAKGYLDGSEIDGGVVDIAAGQKPAQRLKTLRDADMDAETIAAVMPYLAQADSIRGDREKALAGHKEETAREAATQAQQREQAETRDREQQSALFKKIGTDLGSKFAPLQKVEGHDAWNKQVDATLARAEQLYMGGNSDEDVAASAYKAAAFETLNGLYVKVIERNKALNEQVAKLTAQQPDGGTARRDGATPRDPSQPFSYDDAAADFERQLAAVRQ